MTITKYIKTLVALGTVALPLAASASLVTDGNFMASPGGSFVDYGSGTTFGSWEVTEGSIDLIGTYWQNPAGSQSVDLAGYSSGQIQQNISTTSGQWYHLQFALSGNGDDSGNVKSVKVVFGNFITDFTFYDPTHTRTEMKWITVGCDVKADGNLTTLSFLDTSYVLHGGLAVCGAAISDVALTAVPEPSTYIAGVLLLLPFGVSSLRSLRRKS